MTQGQNVQCVQTFVPTVRHGRADPAPIAHERLIAEQRWLDRHAVETHYVAIWTYPSIPPAGTALRTDARVVSLRS